MNNQDLITKAQNQLNSVLRHDLFKIGIEAEEFTQAAKLDIAPVIIRFSCKNRQDTVDLILNSNTGEFISMIHTPKPVPKN
jgi:hypothetical protein